MTKIFYNRINTDSNESKPDSGYPTLSTHFDEADRQPKTYPFSNSSEPAILEDYTPEDEAQTDQIALKANLKNRSTRDTQLGRIEKFLLRNYRFRYNIVTSRLEYLLLPEDKTKDDERPGGSNWEPMTEYVENSMLRDLIKNSFKTNITTVHTLLRSDFSQRFDPFADYFNNLAPWDGQNDYIGMLADTVTTTRQPLWQECFRKWIVALVGCALDAKVINQTVIVFTGKQGVGKTTWMENLVPDELKQYLYSGSVNPNNRDALTHLTECLLINLDELENLNRSETGALKELITKTQIRLRRAFGRHNETLPRRASFAGSVNTAQFLNDTTGSRRFLCFEVTGIRYRHTVSLQGVYAQALHLYKTGFRYWFNDNEINNINENNEQYQLPSPEEELLLTWYEPCIKEESDVFLSASQIAARLSEKAAITITDGMVNKLGKVLSRHKFLKLKRHGVNFYALHELRQEQVEQNSYGIDKEGYRNENSDANLSMKT